MKGKKKMRSILVVCIVGLSLPAMAQQLQPITSQGEFLFKLTGPDLELISKGLGTQPYVDVVPLMQKMQKQYIDQQPKPKPAEVPAEPKKSE